MGTAQSKPGITVAHATSSYDMVSSSEYFMKHKNGIAMILNHRHKKYIINRDNTSRARPTQINARNKITQTMRINNTQNYIL